MTTQQTTDLSSPLTSPSSSKTRREVTNEDVTGYASRKCKTCLGTGWLRKWNFLDQDHMERTTGFCGCAVRRFNSLAAELVEKDPETGKFWWKSPSPE